MNVLDRLRRRIPKEELLSDDELEEILETAKNIILARRFPFGDWPDEVEPKYRDLQVRIAIDLINKIGAEGQIGHTENGVSRTYESSWVSEQLLKEITPMASTLR